MTGFFNNAFLSSFMLIVVFNLIFYFGYVRANVPEDSSRTAILFWYTISSVFLALGLSYLCISPDMLRSAVYGLVFSVNLLIMSLLNNALFCNNTNVSINSMYYVFAIPAITALSSYIAGKLP